MGNYIKPSSLLPTEEIQIGDEQYPIIFPFNNEQVKSFCHRYQLNAKEVADLHAIFCRIDVDFKGFITIEGFLELLRETEDSIVCPYLKGVFKLVKKHENGRVDFFEWMSMVIDYCLMTTDQLLKYLFRVIDTNDDEVISKKDILKFFSQKHQGRRVFPINYLKLIEVLEIERSDYITKMDFIKVVNNVPFLVYPAVRLQEDMRHTILGETFWNSLVKKLGEWESKKAREKQIQTFEEEALKKKKEKQLKKENNIREFFQGRLKIIERLNNHSVKKSDFFKRCKGRRASEGIILSTNPVYFPDMVDTRRVGSRERYPRLWKDTGNFNTVQADKHQTGPAKGREGKRFSHRDSLIRPRP